MEQKKKCESCKRQKLKTNEIMMMMFGFVVLGFAIYGVIHFIKHF
jgi:hypothetical protein